MTIAERCTLAPFTTLRVGGPADRLAIARSADELRALAIEAQRTAEPMTVIGWGSNLLPSDRGLRGLAAVNLASEIRILEDGLVIADAGCGFQELFLRTVQAGLGGLEFAVGIPGTLGGALVSNAGAYRSSISEFVTRIEVASAGACGWIDPDWMRFRYRDSILRGEDAPQAALIRVELRMPPGDAKASYDEARDYQRQRIGKQPPGASAGSFFKNVESQALADSLANLPERLRQAGVVPAGYLIESVGLKGARLGGAMIGARHANFLLNAGGATASEIRRLAEHAQARVRSEYGAELEPEVLAVGDWSGWEPHGRLEA